MKRTPLKRKRINNKNKEKDKEDLVQRTLMIEMFAEIWQERPHRCFETGDHLGYEAKTLFFHHVLPCFKFPQYTLSKWNIVLVSWNTHNQAEIFPEKCPKIHQLYLELLEKHHNFELNK